MKLFLCKNVLIHLLNTFLLSAYYIRHWRYSNKKKQKSAERTLFNEL